jgi:hypothetical protein
LDVSRAESVERELDRLIEKRHDRRVVEEGEHPAEEMWAESERAYFANKREENRLAWCAYYRRLAVSLRGRAWEYDVKAEMLETSRHTEENT